MLKLELQRDVSFFLKKFETLKMLGVAVNSSAQIGIKDTVFTF